VVDALLVKVPTSAHELMYGQKIAEALGIQPRMGGCWDQGGAANITPVVMPSWPSKPGSARSRWSATPTIRARATARFTPGRAATTRSTAGSTAAGYA
jgi:hypothetical protein